MATTGCACKRIDQIESEVIRTHARLVQLVHELRRMRADFHLAEKLELEATTVEPLKVVERRAIITALKKHPPLHAAKLLGIGKTTLYRRLIEYGYKTPGLRKVA